MTEILCRYSGDREQAIVSYLYGDSGDAGVAERAAFVEHLSMCARCRSELAALEGVRASLGRWAVPEPAGVRREVSPGYGAAPRLRPEIPVSFGAARRSADGAEAASLRSRLRDIPAWARAAAAVLVLGVAAGIANLDVQYDANGLRVRTGWFAPAPATVVESRSADDGSWRAELTALEQRIRADLPPPPSQSAANAGRTLGPDALRRFRTLVEESERRQQRELALRLGEAMREVNVQRQEDLVRIDRNIGAMQNNTGREMMRQRSDLLNYVTVRTAARPQ